VKISYYCHYLHWYRQTFRIIFLYIIECEDFLLLVLPTLVQTDVQHYFSLYNRVRRFLIIDTTYTGTDRRSRLFFFIQWSAKISYYCHYLHWYRQTFNIIFLYIIECEDFLLLVLPTLVQTDVQEYFSLYNRVRRFLIIGTTYTATDRRSTLFFFI
jgi:Zn-dependent peptidase ImmA (M78 family)